MRGEADPLWSRLADAVVEHGYAVEPGFLAPEAVRELALALRKREAGGRFHDAGIGGRQAELVRPMLRGDRICWLEAAETPAEVTLVAALDALRVGLNRALMLGLGELELQYASYAAGRHYVRHRDLSPRGIERVVSLALYLNEGWTAGDGGELVIATADGEVVVSPTGGTLVVFLSERFEHEVRAAGRERLSLSGWFSRRAMEVAGR